ncbi:MAG: response regulator [Spirochaetales bacterium]|nr:response regulator [Spirochaetales bacterium]HPO03460.1 response regulator [Treponemataceae bacterium]
MYRVLLADDEQIVIDSLGFILERNFPGQLEFFSARSGGDAVEICQNNKIDIAFMDINMPGLNGIEAIKSIKSFSPAMLIIVLTAFDRFEYAQQAVNLGVYEYLSKPVNRGRIAETMRNALSQVDIQRRKQLSEIQIREKLDSVVNIVESDFIYSLIFPSDKTGDIESYLDFFNIKDPLYYFLTFEVADLQDGARSQTYLTLRDIISSAASCIIGPLMRNRIVVFVTVDRSLSEQEAQVEIRSFVRTLHSRITTRLGHKVKIGVGPVEPSLSRSLSAYNESLKALISTDDPNAVVYSMDCAAQQSGGGYPADAEKKLLDRALAGDLQSVHSLFASICSWLHQQFPGDMSVEKGKLFELLSLVRHQTRQVQSRFGGFSVWKDSWKQIESIEDVFALEKLVLSSIDECIGVIIEHKQSRMSPIIIKACTIINDNLSRDISLEEISRRVEISPFYFSKLFKEETGENFIEYVTMARVQKAKDLLRDHSRSIKEISADSGYADPNYFSKLFKKIVGLTPTEYRETL